MKRSIPVFLSAMLLVAAGIYSLFADNNELRSAADVFADDWSETPSQPLTPQIDAGNRPPQIRSFDPYGAPQPASRNGTQAIRRNPVVSAKQKRKYQIQITCDRLQKAAAIQEGSDPEREFVYAPIDNPSENPAPVEFLQGVAHAPVWLYCDEFEMKTAEANEDAKTGGYNLKIAGPFVIESPGLSIRGEGLAVQDGQMTFADGKINSGGFLLAVEKCKLPFAIKSLQIDSNRPKRITAGDPIVTY